MHSSRCPASTGSSVPADPHEAVEEVVAAVEPVVARLIAGLIEKIVPGLLLGVAAVLAVAGSDTSPQAHADAD